MTWRPGVLLAMLGVLLGGVLPGIVQARSPGGRPSPPSCTTPPVLATPVPPDAILVCRLGTEYQRTGRLLLARQAYATAVALDPRYAAAARNLLTVSTSSRLSPAALATAIALDLDPFARARALKRLHKYADARTALELAVEANPHAPIPDDLRDLNQGGIPGSLPGVLVNDWDAVVEVWELAILQVFTLQAGEVLLGLLVLLLILCGILFRQRRFRHLRPTQVKMDPFDSGSAGLPIGQEVMAVIGEKLSRFAEQGGGTAPHQVSGAVNPPELSAALAHAPAQFQFLSGILTWALPPDVLCLSGMLHFTPRRGAGLTLSLVESLTGKVVDGVTMWQTDFGWPVRTESGDSAGQTGSTAASAERSSSAPCATCRWSIGA